MRFSPHLKPSLWSLCLCGKKSRARARARARSRVGQGGLGGDAGDLVGFFDLPFKGNVDRFDAFVCADDVVK